MIYEEDKLVKRLREHLEWAQANEWETPITLSDDIEMAIQLLEQYKEMCSNATKTMNMLTEALKDIDVKYISLQDENHYLRNLING